MPFGKKKAEASGDASQEKKEQTATGNTDTPEARIVDPVENLRAILQGAGINPDQFADESDLRAAAKKVNAFLEKNFNNDNLQYALRISRERLQSKEAMSAWSGQGAQKNDIEVHVVNRPGQAASKAQKWMDKKDQATSCEDSLALLSSTDTKNVFSDRSEALYHDFAQLGDNAKANDRVSFERYCSFDDFKSLFMKDNIVLGNANVVRQQVPNKEVALHENPQGGGPRYMFEYVEFIQVPKGVDLKSEDAHFFYGQAATMNAERIYIVPTAFFLKLADEMPDPACKLLFVWSTGRCGSTLISQLLHTHPSVTASLSEPPQLLQIGKLNSFSEFRIHTGGKKKEWAKAIIKMLLKNYASPEHVVCLKPHPMAIEGVPILRQVVPGQHVFLYRDAAPNIESWHQTLLEEEGSKPGDMFLPLQWFSIVPPQLAPKYRHPAFLLLRRGMITTSFKYEDIVARPTQVLEGLLGNMVPKVDDLDARVSEAMSRDSQGAGTYVPKKVYTFSQEEAEKFKEIHTDFGVIGFYDAKKLEADTGPLHLPNSLLA